MRWKGETPSFDGAPPPGSHPSSLRRWLLWELPLWIVLLLVAFTHITYNWYTGSLQRLVECYRRHDNMDEMGYYTEFVSDVTYYARQCTADDITTNTSQELMVPETATGVQAADIMMTHGAVILQNLSSNTAAEQLRAHLETRHKLQDDLSWHETCVE